MIAWLFGAAGSSAWGATNSTDALADAELPRLRQLVTSRNYALMGFHSSREVWAASISRPSFDVHQVRLDQLRVYSPTNDPTALLQPADLRIYPVTVKGQTRSSIMLGHYTNGWTAVGYGYPHLAKLLTGARAKRAVMTGLPLDKFFAVQVRALNVVFLGYYETNKLVVSSLLSDPAVNLIAGEARPAEQSFGALVPAAQQQQDLPR